MSRSKLLEYISQLSEEEREQHKDLIQETLDRQEENDAIKEKSESLLKEMDEKGESLSDCLEKFKAAAQNLKVIRNRLSSIESVLSRQPGKGGFSN